VMSVIGGAVGIKDMRNSHSFLTIVAILLVSNLSFPQVKLAGARLFSRVGESETIQANGLPRQMEKLDRGLLAVKVDQGVFLSWRLFGNDDRNVKFNLYRNDTLVNIQPITGAINFIDSLGTVASLYRLKALVNDSMVDTSAAVHVWPHQYLTIQLNRPSGGITPDSVAYTYTPNDLSVGDLNGDNQYEFVVKWDPSNSKDNSQSGYTGDVFLDAYELNGKMLWRIDLGENIRAGAHYTQFLVYDFDGDGKAEVVCKTAPGTIDGTGHYLSKGPAATDDPTADYRTMYGYILSGPEYLTVFNGPTGKELATVSYDPPRGNVANWGDSYGNRVDRFLACVAYLDGTRPSIIMCRGYYTRAFVAAWDWRDGRLTERWIHDSGNIPGVGAYYQGGHNLAVADVDGDGKDEILYTACAFDDDGTLMYRTGLGHGDAMHVGHFDPDRSGFEVWAVHEDVTAKYGYQLHDARTGEILWGGYTGTDNGRGLAADIDSMYMGFEMWSASGVGVYDCKGNSISKNKPSNNFRIYWDGDLRDELLDGTHIDKWTGNGTVRLMSFEQYGAHSNNGTKATPCLSADILGDWREEVIYYNANDPSQLLLFTTVIPTQYRIYTLMHDPTYRLGVAWQNVAYNQPPYLGFYIGGGIENMPWPNMYTAASTPTGISYDHHEVSPSFELNQNYPNPFNPSTIISYKLPMNGHVTLKVFDVLGREVRTLVDEYEKIGRYEVTFSAEGGDGSRLSSGVYFYQLRVSGETIVKKMLLEK
jgi:rhamnogalacturonan endolyase